ncbi:hypothetical protein F4821DRAFT_244600 [Hypoxylon rubiginosum]|uniref:Uncharacterized protein n=1 Tax=Hypoxylon rubiginosum TaxID=110542 RepID=A0ACC0CT15_9PEZI|nr:hypothetical protein F4821DRAFT_244600 [Hypoxylon rubiginosum]
MVLKRKRSESEFSFDSSSTFCSPTRLDQFANVMDTDGDNSSFLRRFQRNTTPAHLSGRTMKRFRDSRPSDEEVHQRTLNMLYSAQKQHVAHEQQSPFGSLATQPQPEPAAPSHGSQASLHNFWKLPPKPAAVSHGAVRAQVDQHTNCDDCGQTLREGLGDDDSMDVDGFGADAETGCAACGKHVCSHCSITNLGEQRRCLICAGKKVWIGGLGWAGISGLKVC